MSSPATSGPGDTAELLVCWWPWPWPPRFATLQSCGREQARDRLARAGPCPEWVQGGRGWPLGTGTPRDWPRTALHPRPFRGLQEGRGLQQGPRPRVPSGAPRPCLRAWDAVATVGGGDCLVLLHLLLIVSPPENTGWPLGKKEGKAGRGVRNRPGGAFCLFIHHHYCFWLRRRTCGILSPPTRDQTREPFSGGESLDHWTPRTALKGLFVVFFAVLGLLYCVQVFL